MWQCRVQGKAAGGAARADRRLLLLELEGALLKRTPSAPPLTALPLLSVMACAEEEEGDDSDSSFGAGDEEVGISGGKRRHEDADVEWYMGHMHGDGTKG